ncbi:MAG: SDR family oxidoreductase [Clostridiaceae bacterium]|nr:SDR family oxidoreductase [Clostridiaceae bacterium]
MVQKNKIILVTGASSGLGLAVATHLSETGYIVYAGARSFSNDTSEDGTLKKIHLDVTDQAGIDSTVKKIIETEGRIDVLINCAAIQVLGSVEDLTWEEFENVFLTNTGGVVRMCKAVLPFMRNRNEGQIINFSSIMGLVAVPFQSAYTASKFAVEGFTETLRMETRNYGIKVSMVEPTDYKSGSVKYRPHTAAADLLSSPYYDLFRKVTAKIEYDEAHGSEPEKLARLIGRIVQARRPRLRYMSGKFDQKLSVLLKKILPGKMFESIIYGYYKDGPKNAKSQ